LFLRLQALSILLLLVVVAVEMFLTVPLVVVVLEDFAMVLSQYRQVQR
jgi:hypothetical protein